MSISDEAVEAAAKAMYELHRYGRRSLGGYTHDARAALEAAAPYMLAEAWRDGCAEGLACDWDKGAEHLPLNPYKKP